MLLILINFIIKFISVFCQGKIFFIKLQFELTVNNGYVL